MKAKSYRIDAFHQEQDLESEGHHASNADPSALFSREGPSESSGVHNPDEPSLGHQRDPRSVVRLDPRDPQYVVQQHATERTKVRQPRLGGRDRRSYRAPPALMDAGGNQRFLVGRLLAHRSVTQGYQILVQWKVHRRVLTLGNRSIPYVWMCPAWWLPMKRSTCWGHFASLKWTSRRSVVRRNRGYSTPMISFTRKRAKLIRCDRYFIASERR